MKKILLFLLLFCWQSHAIDKSSTLKVYYELFSSILHRSSFSVYTQNRTYRNTFATFAKIKIAATPRSADIILITKNDTLRNIQHSYGSRTILFATKYSLLKRSKDIIGAFYWRKGRAQILFIKDRLRRKGITLPNKYIPYTRDTL